ncbi:Ido1 [Symbiodinium necroappetens]|uniref:Ido1 protein n=1 Tax=Symbiodinium necroappetens TaxID=1628268 RepID=A0A813AGW8_9DINO|nr:Ido1 [Symbiodinium necroappetens]
MTIGTFSVKEHVQSTLDTLIDDPLKANELWNTPPNIKEEVDWDSRDDEVVITPPFLGDDADSDKPWRDLDNHAGEQAPTIPDLLLDTDVGEVTAHEVEESMGQWPSQAALAAIFRDTTTAELRREWGLEDDPTIPRQAPSPPPEERDSQLGDQKGDNTVVPSLDQDELVRQVMSDLKDLGGDPRHKGDDLEEVEVETRPQASRTGLSAQVAGAQLGLKIKRKADEERRRTLKVGDLVVKLPPPREGGTARGSLMAKVQRLSSTMSSSSSGGTPAETLRAKLKRMAAVLDEGEHTTQKVQKGNRGTRGGARRTPATSTSSTPKCHLSRLRE